MVFKRIRLVIKASKAWPRRYVVARKATYSRKLNKPQQSFYTAPWEFGPLGHQVDPDQQ